MDAPFSLAAVPSLTATRQAADPCVRMERIQSQFLCGTNQSFNDLFEQELDS
jgi:hypothetical protein